MNPSKQCARNAKLAKAARRPSPTTVAEIRAAVAAVRAREAAAREPKP